MLGSDIFRRTAKSVVTMKDVLSKDHILRLWLQSLHPAQDHFGEALVPRPVGHWLVVHGSILTGVVVGTGHKGDLDVADCETSEGQHRNEKCLGRVHVLKDGPWRL